MLYSFGRRFFLKQVRKKRVLRIRLLLVIIQYEYSTMMRLCKYFTTRIESMQWVTRVKIGCIENDRSCGCPVCR